MEGSEEVRTTDDIRPCVMTDNLGAFLTTTRNNEVQQVTLHLTRDRGASWQEVPLEEFEGVHDVLPAQSGLPGTILSAGTASAPTGRWAPAWGMAIGVTRDGGVSWEHCALPGESQSELLSGVVFYDEQTAVATPVFPV